MGNTDQVHATVRRIDATMLALTRTLQRFGVPKGMGSQLNHTKNAVGDLVAHLEMTERRS